MTVSVGPGFGDDSYTPINLGFTFLVAGVNVGGGRIYLSANSYITFNGASTAFQNLGNANPPVRTVFVGARDASWSRVLWQKTTIVGTPTRYRVRWEGYNRNSASGSTAVVWEASFYSDNKMELCIGATNALTASGGTTGVSSGKGSWLASFTLQVNSLYSITGLQGV